MDRYLLLRSNVQTGPHTFENLLKLGLNSQDLIWIDGRSNSWRYPTEMDEFKKFISSTSKTDIGFDKPPMSRTRLQNDYILIKGLTENSVIGNRHIPEQELFEFPTLARFFMAEKYREMPEPVVKLTQETKKLEPLFKANDANIPKSKVWVSYPKTATKKTVVVIKGIPEKQKEEKKSAPVITIARPAAAIFNKEIKEKEVAELKPLKTTPPVIIRMGETLAPVEEVPVAQVAEPAAIVIKNGFAAIQHQPESFSFSEEPVVEKIHFAGSRFRKPFSFSLQSFAVAVALASLMMVGLLIANSIINPAYQLKTLNSNKSTIPVKAEKNNAVTVPASTVPIATPTANPELLTPKNVQVENNGPPIEENKTKADEKKVVVTKKTKDTKPALATVAPAITPGEEMVTNVESGTEKEETSKEAEEQESSIKNISQLVQVKMSDYRTGLFGGIKEFDLVVKNNSDYPLDHVTVELTYIQANKKVYKTETIQFASIAPQSQKSIEIPKSARGIKVESIIKSIASGDLSYSK